MHQGQLASLGDVVRFYSRLEEAEVDMHHAQPLIQPLGLSEQEEADLVAFLESLTDESVAEELLEPPESPRWSSGEGRFWSAGSQDRGATSP